MKLKIVIGIVLLLLIGLVSAQDGLVDEIDVDESEYIGDWNDDDPEYLAYLAESEGKQGFNWTIFLIVVGGVILLFFIIILLLPKKNMPLRPQSPPQQPPPFKQ